MKSFLAVWREIIANRVRIVRLARYEQRAKNSGTILGRLWDFLTPVLQICVYWFVFSVGLRITTMEGNIPYAVWMMTGLIPWFCISGAMQSSASAISASSSIIRNLNIPMSIIPVKDVISHLMEHLWTLAFLIFVLFVSGIQPSWYMLQIVYYFFCMVVFLIAFALFASSIGIVIKDFGRFLSPIIRLMFYLSSAIMSLDGLSPNMRVLLKINPITYIIMGYRNALLYNVGIWDTLRHGTCFWVITLALLFIGCSLHMRTRERFVDLL
ncbi:MAG: ABC transporter permease [Clostridia bacterium]